MNRGVWLLGLVLAAGVVAWLAMRNDDGGAAVAPTTVDRPADEEAAPALRGVESAPDGGTAAGTAETPEDAGRGAILFRGAVTAEDGSAVAGAVVHARVGGRELARVTSGADGAFSFRAEPALPDAARATVGVLAAEAPDGRVGLAHLYVGSLAMVEGTDGGAERALPPLVVKPAAALDLVVRSTCPDALPATVWVLPASFGTSEPILRVATDAEGHARLAGLPQGLHRILVAAPGCGRTAHVVKLPQPEPVRIELELPDAHALTVSVVEDGTGEPVPGAVVSVSERVSLPHGILRATLVSVPSTYTAGDDGTVVVGGLGGDERLFLDALAEGFPSQAGRRGKGSDVRVEAGAAEARITLARARTIRWPIEDKGQGIPPDGTAITLRPYANSGFTDIPRAGTVAGGQVVVDGWAPGHAAGIAYADGFGAALLQALPDAVEGRATAFHPLRRIVLVARHHDGTPAEGYYLSAYDGGNNRVAPPAVTDAEGRAVLEELFSGPFSQVDCRVWTDDSPHGGWPVGAVDLAAQDGQLEFTVPRTRALRVTIRVGGGPPPEGFRASMRAGMTPQLLEPDERGVCELTIQPPPGLDEMQIFAQARGYKPASSAPVDLRGDGVLEAALDFVQLGEARIRVKLPEDGRHKISMQRWDPEARTWPPAPQPNMHNWTPGGLRADGEGWAVFQVEPGRYRAFDAYSGQLGAPMDVRVGTPATSTLDLSRAGWIQGRVVPPEGVPVAGFTVGALDAQVVARPRIPGMGGGGLPGTPVNGKDGTFWYRTAGDGPVTLRTFHATCAPHPTKGRVTVTGAREGVELHAVQGANAKLRFDPPLRMWLNRGSPRGITIRLYRGAVEGEGTQLSGVVDGEGAEVVFGGYEPGRYTVWVDTIVAAPLVLRDVDLTAAGPDLGTHAPPSGASFYLNVEVKEGQSPPRLSVWAQCLDEPGYTRRADAAGARIHLGGLGKGRFRISASSYAGTGTFVEEIELDGETDVERTFDLR